MESGSNITIDDIIKFAKSDGVSLKRIIFFIPIVIIVGWGYARYPYYEQNIALGSVAPCYAHWFGTDQLGRDLFSRVVYACSISLTIGAISSCLAVAFGGIYGIVSGYCGGLIDQLLMRWIDIFYPIPLTLIVILMMILFGQHVSVLFVAISSVEWMTTARIIRAETLKLKESGYIQVAKGFGESQIRIMSRHIAPNLWHVLRVCFFVTLPGVILLESFLSFIGLGIQPPRSSLGILIADGAKRIGTYPWEVIFPSLVMISVMLIINVYNRRLDRRI